MVELERRTLAEQAYLELRAQILNDEYLPGAELHEVALADGLGVSRGPVREALRRLASEGLVEIRPRRGAVISSLTRKDFLDAYLVREELEALAVRLAGSQLTTDDIVELEDALRNMDAAIAQNDDVGVLRENQRFHGLLVERAENSFLQATYRYVVDSMVRYRRRSVMIRGGLDDLTDEHRAILDALKAGDVAAAEELTRHHVRVPVQRIGQFSDDQLALPQADTDAADQRVAGASDR